MSPSQPYQALRRAAGLVDRADRGLLWLTGADRRALLHGLLTNDIASLTPGSGCYAALLTPNGRMITDMRVLELGDGMLVALENGLAQPLLDRLDRSIFTEDVQLRNVSTERAGIGIYGPAAAATVARAAAVPTLAADLDRLAEHASLRHDVAGHQVLMIRSAEIGVEGFDCVVDAGAGDAVAGALRRAGAIDVDGETAEICRIEAGRPRFTIDMDEDTIPLEAGIESRAISFTKGCYVGQEIIIRVMHRGGGRVARRLVGLALGPEAPVPVRGDGIQAAERSVGTVTSAAWSPALEQPIALGYVQRDFTEAGTPLTIGAGETARPATVHALPFVAAPAPSAS